MLLHSQRLTIEISRNSIAATRATSGTTMCSSTVNASPLSAQQQQQQQQDADNLTTNSNIIRTIDTYPIANGTPVRYCNLMSD